MKTRILIDMGGGAGTFGGETSLLSLEDAFRTRLLDDSRIRLVSIPGSCVRVRVFSDLGLRYSMA